MEVEGLESNKVKLERIADEMLQVAVNNKISCSEIEMVMYYLERKIKRRAGDKEL